MKRKTLVLAASAALIAAAAALPALAQDGVYEEDPIVVYPYRIDRETTGRGPLGQREQTYALSAVVTTAGLDLRYDEDVRALRRRVDYTAREVCEELDDAIRGPTLTSDRECVQAAVRNARPQVQAAVYRARY